MTDTLPSETADTTVDPTATPTPTSAGGDAGPEVWVDVCAVGDVPLDRGVAALVAGAPVAIFRLSPTEPGGEVEWYAVSHVEPASGALIMARGLVGSADTAEGSIPTVASPLLKERYDLSTGACLDDPTRSLATYDLRVVGDRVEISPHSG
ncbi:MAG: nitrite reductase (NAD(P)H) small subunit [Actinomycetota bacterium]